MTDEQPLSPGNQVIPGHQELTDVKPGSLAIPVIPGVSGGDRSPREHKISKSERLEGMGLDPRPFVSFDQEKAITLLIEYPKNISHICRVLGVHRKTWDYHMRTDPEFKQMVQDIEEAHCDELEGTMLHLGKQKTSFNFNDRIAYLRAHRPELYNPARKIVVESHTMSADEINRRSAVLGQAVDAQIVNAYTTRKERAQAKREGSSLLPSGESEGGGGADGKA